jgi:hypothetical protein
MSKYTPTVDQIAQDRITHLAHKYWLNLDASATGKIEFNSNLVDDIYSNELHNSK